MTRRISADAAVPPLEPRLPPLREELAADLARRLAAPGTTTLVSAEAGFGKTTVIDRVLDLVAARSPGTRVLFARGVRSSVPTPHVGLHELFTGVDPKSLDLPPGHASGLCAALGRSSIEGELTPARVMMSTHSVILRLLEISPVAIVVDDWDALDAESAEVIRYLTSRRYTAGGAPSLLLAYASPRPDDAFGESVVALPPLSPRDVQAVAQDATGRTLPLATATRVQALSGGNPLWALEMAAVDDADASSSLEEAMRQRIERASPAARRILAALGAAGPLSAEHLHAAASVSDADILEAIDGGAVEEHRGRVTARHPMLSATALQGLSEPDRRALHGRISEVVVDPVARTDHLERATPPGAQPALARALDEAAMRARSQGAVGEATDLAGRAVRRTSADDPALARRRISWADLALRAGDFAGVLDALGGVEFERLDVALLDRALPLLVTAAAAERGDAAARAMLHAAASPTDDPVRQAVYDTYRAEAGHEAGDRLALARGAADLLRRAGAAPLSRHRALGALILDDLDAGRGLDDGLLAECAALETQIDLLAVNDSARAMTGLYAHQVGQLERSRQALEAMHAVAVEQGQEVVAGVFALHLAATEAQAGDLARAEHWLDFWEQVNPWPDTPPPSAIAAMGLRALRRADADEIERIVRLPHGPGGEAIGRLVRQALLGLTAARTQNWASALSALTSARSLADSLGMAEPGRRLWLDFDLARTLIAVGDLSAAGDIAAGLEEISAGGRPLLDGVAASIRGEIALARDDSSAAVDALTQADALLREAEMPFERSRTQLALARAHHARRARHDAVAALDAAESSARRASDAGLVGRIVALRGEVEASTPAGVLTERERVVALAVARGSTNREIADEYHLSVRTVESQLSAAYRKLGVRSRSELAVLMRQSG
ncbi:LuxR C-terminal-related transcriptional regulator [Microbacterium sp. ET2]|uniref:helix-turn-helix transcriptional regulator n=1 Tax=Microbacterium albipurpureum TaxID=3050384 RepID=UPI00259CB27B|nr:LuxR C-terminal-related transcriptional regulator [Microbacterium sp. ET2 (Ac-2212)]WJL94107.1 LuxR C-terminal-related transcriptional regulator [Microbacterium sp. ET2 (Ac-2212)]